MEQSSLDDSGVLVDNPNDMSGSGILVEKPQDETTATIATNSRSIDIPTNASPHRRYMDEDDEDLQFSLREESRQKRMQQLAADQRSKRSAAQQQGRTNPTPKTTKPNPFSRFLTAFSVDSQYPHHKRAHDEREEAEEPPLKHARTLEEDDEYDDPTAFTTRSSTSDIKNLLTEITETLRENSIPFMAVGAAVASLALMTLIRKKA